MATMLAGVIRSSLAVTMEMHSWFAAPSNPLLQFLRETKLLDSGCYCKRLLLLKHFTHSIQFSFIRASVSLRQSRSLTATSRLMFLE